MQRTTKKWQCGRLPEEAVAHQAGHLKERLVTFASQSFVTSPSCVEHPAHATDCLFVWVTPVGAGDWLTDCLVGWRLASWLRLLFVHVAVSSNTSHVVGRVTDIYCCRRTWRRRRRLHWYACQSAFPGVILVRLFIPWPGTSWLVSWLLLRRKKWRVRRVK